MALVPSGGGGSDPGRVEEIGDEGATDLGPEGSVQGPLVCVFKGVGDAVAGGAMGSVFGFGSGVFKRQGFKVALAEGGKSAKTFALLSGVHSLVSCFLRQIRGKHDAINAGIAGCATGLVLSAPGNPQALLQGCLSFGVFSFVLERFSHPQAALAAHFGAAPHMLLQKKQRNIPIQIAFPLFAPFVSTSSFLTGITDDFSRHHAPKYHVDYNDKQSKI
ncbi:hypothetical protein O6H91_09G103400 [Diphasiastrum complanatum]|uniref:Uncharacterized protein n=1 Tax=Diphasiastrum complanatum TaxID=34168 RepID=A0ACC2CSL1_DIPCM|nr:hypothetical protein O6H91_09G103400 [Diphasiastrum complanatum]